MNLLARRISVLAVGALLCANLAGADYTWVDDYDSDNLFQYNSQLNSDGSFSKVGFCRYKTESYSDYQTGILYNAVCHPLIDDDHEKQSVQYLKNFTPSFSATGKLVDIDPVGGVTIDPGGSGGAEETFSIYPCTFNFDDSVQLMGIAKDQDMLSEVCHSIGVMDDGVYLSETYPVVSYLSEKKGTANPTSEPGDRSSSRRVVLVGILGSMIGFAFLSMPACICMYNTCGDCCGCSCALVKALGGCAARTGLSLLSQLSALVTSAATYCYAFPGQCYNTMTSGATGQTGELDVEAPPAYEETPSIYRAAPPDYEEALDTKYEIPV